MNVVFYSVSNVQCYGIGANPVKFPTYNLVMFFIFYFFKFGFKEFIHCWLINNENYDRGWPLKLTFGMNCQLNMHTDWQLKVILGSHCIVYIFVRILIWSNVFISQMLNVNVVFFFLEIFSSVRVRNNKNCVNFLELCKYQTVISIVLVWLKNEIYSGFVSPRFIFNINKIYNTRHFSFIMNWTQQKI